MEKNLEFGEYCAYDLSELARKYVVLEDRRRSGSPEEVTSQFGGCQNDSIALNFAFNAVSLLMLQGVLEPRRLDQYLSERGVN